MMQRLVGRFLTCLVLLIGVAAIGPGGIARAQSGLAIIWFLGFNTTQPPFDNVTARRAVAKAIDRVRIAESVERPPGNGY